MLAIPHDCLAVDAIVVRPAAWSAAIQPWKAYRASQGIEVLEVDAGIGRQAIRSRIAEVAQASGGRLRFVLLAGDVTDPTLVDVNLPTFHYPSSAMVQFGGDPTIATDNSYADLDGDHSPELAIGRIPADSAEQLAAYLERVRLYEQQRDFSNWRRRIHVVAGVGGFGAIADSVIDMTTRRFLSDRIPGWCEMSMTQASLQSVYCPDPLQFSTTCIERMNQGGMFWVYIGHGHIHTLDALRAGEQILPIMTRRDVPAVDTAGRPPIAVFLACYTGAFDAREDSLAEQLVNSQTGPIAAIAASRVSGPYGLAMLSDGLLQQCFDLRSETLGEVMLHAKQNLLNDNRFSAEHAGLDQIGMINAIADAMSPADYDLRAERLEHVWQMNLLGDPMLRLNHPQTLEFSLPTQVAPGERFTLHGRTAEAGMLTAELSRCRGQVPSHLKLMQVGLDSPQARDNYQQRYRDANNGLIAVREMACSKGEFSIDLSVPETTERGKYCLRLYLAGNDHWHVGYQEIRVRDAAP